MDDGSIEKFDGVNHITFKVGDRVTLENYSKEPWGVPGTDGYWPGTRYAIIVGIDPPDLDYSGGVYVFIEPSLGHWFVERTQLIDVYLEGKEDE